MTHRSRTLRSHPTRIDIMLIQLINMLHFLSFFPEACLFKEIKQILHHLEIVFAAYHLSHWEKTVRLIQCSADSNWPTFKTFDFWKFKWSHWKIRKKIISLLQKHPIDAKIINRLEDCGGELLMDAFFELDRVRQVLKKRRPILFGLVVKKLDLF